MIRKLVTIAAAIAIPVSAVTALGAVIGTGVAGAKGSPPTAISCTQTGSVAFAKPGESHGGTLTKKSSEKSKTTITAAGTGCSTKTLKLTITTPTTACAGASSPAPVCSTGDVAKDPNFYDNAGGFISGGTSDILSSLSKGIKTTDNGTAITLLPTAASAIDPGGSCGAAGVGFALSGTVSAKGVTGFTFADNVCLTGDTGPNTTNDFLTDLAGADGGGDQIITSAIIGSPSTLTINS